MLHTTANNTSPISISGRDFRVFLDNPIETRLSNKLPGLHVSVSASARSASHLEHRVLSAQIASYAASMRTEIRASPTVL